MEKQRMMEILRNALGCMDVLLVELDNDKDSDGCQQDRICEMLDISDDEFDEIKESEDEDYSPDPEDMIDDSYLIDDDEDDGGEDDADN